MARDRRFVALHRGGLLDPASHRLLAAWAADCADHALGPVYYGITAVKAAASDADAQQRAAVEHEWQLTRLPDDVRDLVVSAVDEGSVLGTWRP